MRRSMFWGVFAVVVAWAVGRVLTAAPRVATPNAVPTFSKDVAPIFYKNCASCHQPNSVAPMSLLDFKAARPYARSIRRAVETRTMPPWFADPEYGHFQNDSRLSDREIATILAWVDTGAA